MISFLVAAAVLLCLVVAFLIVPLWRGRQADATATESPALRVLREQRAELDAELANARISPDEHATRLGELQRRALEEGEKRDALATGGRRRIWAVAIGILLPLSVIAAYLVLGNLDALNPERVSSASHEMTPEQIETMVTKLAARVKANPDNIEDAKMLARSYMVLGRFNEASSLLEQLASKAPDAQIYADWADALASAHDRQLEGEPEKLIVKALQLDPKNVKALALSGTLAFERKDYKQAASEWEKIMVSVDPDSEFGQSVQTMLQEARTRAGMPDDTPRIAMQGTVSLSAKLKSHAAADDSVFIFARNDAGGPPLAGLRFKVSELPVSFDFSQAQVMMGKPQKGQKIVIGARISKAGNPLPQPGDLQGFSKPVALDAKAVRIEINELVGGQ